MAFDLGSILQGYAEAQKGFNPNMAEWREKQQAKRQQDMLFASEMKIREEKIREAEENRQVKDHAQMYLQIAPLINSDNPDELMQARQIVGEFKNKLTNEKRDPRFAATFEQLLSVGPDMPGFSKRVEVMNKLGEGMTDYAYQNKLLERPPPIKSADLKEGIDKETGQKAFYDASDPSSAKLFSPITEAVNIVDRQTGIVTTAKDEQSIDFGRYDVLPKGAIVTLGNDGRMRVANREKKADSGGSSDGGGSELGLSVILFRKPDGKVVPVQPSRTEPMSKYTDMGWEVVGTASQKPETMQELSTAKEAGKSANTTLDEMQKAATSARKNIAMLDNIISLSPDASEGALQPVIDMVKNIFVSFGADFEGEVAKVGFEQAVSGMLSNYMSELGARGLTDADMKVLSSSLPKLTSSHEARVAAANTLKKLYQNTMTDYLLMEEQFMEDNPTVKRQHPAWFDYEYEQALQR